MKSFGVVFLFIAAFLLIGLGLNRQKESKDHVLDNCVPTNLYTIQYKGRITQIYKCPQGFKL